MAAQLWPLKGATQNQFTTRIAATYIAKVCEGTEGQGQMSEDFYESHDEKQNRLSPPEKPTRCDIEHCGRPAMCSLELRRYCVDHFIAQCYDRLNHCNASPFADPGAPNPSRSIASCIPARNRRPASFIRFAASTIWSARGYSIFCCGLRSSPPNAAYSRQKKRREQAPSFALATNPGVAGLRLLVQSSEREERPRSALFARPSRYDSPGTSPISSFQTSGCAAMYSASNFTHSRESRSTTFTPNERNHLTPP